MFSFTKTTLTLLAIVFLAYPLSSLSDAATPPTVCIIGSGIGGSSLAHFIRKYSNSTVPRIQMFERNDVVGGRMATVSVSGDTFEAGASILHPKNYHALDFTKLLNLKVKRPPSSEDSLSLGIWNGKKFIFKTISVNSKAPLVQKIVSFANSLYLFLRYGFSLLKMGSFVEVCFSLLFFSYSLFFFFLFCLFLVDESASLFVWCH